MWLLSQSQLHYHQISTVKKQFYYEEEKVLYMRQLQKKAEGHFFIRNCYLGNR